MVHRLPVAGESRLPIHQPARFHRRPGGRAEMGEIAQALLAGAAGRRPRESDVIADGDPRRPRPDRFDDARPFVAENGRAARLGSAVDRVQIGVTDARGAETHEHLARPGWRKIEVLDVKRPACRLEHRGTDLHGAAAASAFRRPCGLQRTQLLQGDVAPHQVVAPRLRRAAARSRRRSCRADAGSGCGRRSRSAGSAALGMSPSSLIRGRSPPSTVGTAESNASV